ncbi:response regulator transcription factor [Halomonas sp. NO4]|uniref:response regulator n=1 Tax=Halomonas sp. NO4 TaxID=2484813 RepID=UPI0013D5F998|nr:response regulator transcription factor [Halomonas sp. NO4]
MIKVVIADDHGIVREGMRSLISSTPEMEVVGEADNGDAALAQVLKCQPTVLLMDMSMPGNAGLQLVEAVRRRAPDTCVLVLSMHREEQYAARVIRAGAHGFITKSRPPEELLTALREVARGQLYIPGELAHKLALQALTGQPEGQPHARLTKREYQVFMALAQGLTVGVIAARLHLSSKTVSTHKARILKKLDVDSLSGLIRYAVEHDLL